MKKRKAKKVAKTPAISPKVLKRLKVLEEEVLDLRQLYNGLEERVTDLEPEDEVEDVKDLEEDEDEDAEAEGEAETEQQQ